MSQSDLQRQKLQMEAKFLLRTPTEEIGPMYPVHELEDRGSDLAYPATPAGRRPDPLYIQGKLLDLTGQLIEGASV